MISEDQLQALQGVCPGAKVVHDNKQPYISLPNLKIVVGTTVKEMQGLLCPNHHGGYSTRLFLNESVPEATRTANWTIHTILGKTWHTWSWQGVSENLPLVQMLLAHVGALR